MRDHSTSRPVLETAECCSGCRRQVAQCMCVSALSDDMPTYTGILTSSGQWVEAEPARVSARAA